MSEMMKSPIVGTSQKRPMMTSTTCTGAFARTRRIRDESALLDDGGAAVELRRSLRSWR